MRNKIQNSKYSILNARYLILATFFVVAFLERVFFDLGPNIELVTVSILLAAAYLGKKEAVLLALSTMVITDLFIGNSNIFIFTWTGFLIPAVFASNFFEKTKNTGVKKVFNGLVAGIGTTSFFFLWTNFGVWMTTGMYAKTFSGLLASYINALPFLRMHAVSTLLFVTTGFFIAEYAPRFVERILIGKNLNFTFKK